MLKFIASFGGAFILMVSCTYIKIQFPITPKYSIFCNPEVDGKQQGNQSDFILDPKGTWDKKMNYEQGLLFF